MDDEHATTYRSTRDRAHPRCRLCGDEPADLPELQFQCADTGIWARFQATERQEGYAGWLHGGVAAAVLDAACTNALFARGVTAVTAKLELSYRHPLFLHTPITVIARLVDQRAGAWRVRASLHQGDRRAVSATALFMPAAVTKTATGEKATG